MLAEARARLKGPVTLARVRPRNSLVHNGSGTRPTDREKSTHKRGTQLPTWNEIGEAPIIPLSIYRPTQQLLTSS